MKRIPILLVLPLLFVVSAAGKPPEKPADKRVNADDPEKLSVESALVTVIELAEVPARVEGVLAELTAREGQLVADGAPLARIDDAEPVLTLKRAAFEFDIARKQAASDIKIRVAKKAAELADVELKRARESIEKYKKSVSETELDRLRLAAEKALLDVDQAVQDQQIAELTMQLKQTERELAESAVDRRRIRAPLAGMIVQIHKHRGEWVEPGQTLLRILRVDRLRVEGLVNIRKITGDLIGRRATLAVDLPGRGAGEFEGAVVFVSPEVNPVNGQVRIWAEVENRDLVLRPGLQGELTVHPEAARTAKRE
jgi:macrolide-specific efflux system membrane fusion protein